MTEPINPYEPPIAPEDERLPTKAIAPEGLHTLAKETNSLSRWLLVAAYITGIPAGFAGIGAILLLTANPIDRVFAALIAAVLLWITVQLTTLRSTIRRFDRRTDITLATLLVRQLGQLFFSGFILLLLALVTNVVLLLFLVTS